MFVHLPHIRNSGLQQAMYIVCLFFVFSYIAFDLLDLDESNLPRLFSPVQKTIIVAVAPTEAEGHKFFEAIVPHNNSLIPLGEHLGRFTSAQRVKLFILSAIHSFRAHHYMVGLARDSLSDSSPYH